MAGVQVYSRKVMNKSGYVVEFPSVADMDGLLDGTPTLNPYAESATQEFPLGTKLTNGERVWRYAKNGAGTPGAGCPLQTAAVLHAEAPDDIVVGAASAIGAYTVTLTSTANLACAANYFAEGYLIVNDAAGEGHSYKIKSHPAFAGTADSIVTLYDPIIVALTTSSQCGMAKNPYDSLIAASAATITGMPIGIAPILLTAAYYFWVQTGGPCAAVVQAAITLGNEVCVGTTASKVNATVDDSTLLNTIGFAMTPGVADTESCLVFLTLDR